MTSFPHTPFDTVGNYLEGYAREIQAGFATIDRDAMQKAADCLGAAVARRAEIFTCGNGGSAAIANHFVCDHTKGVRSDTHLEPRVHSLVANIELLTATANDIAFDSVFSFPLETYGTAGDVLVAITSSGNSKNIQRALEVARGKGLHTIVMTGFTGGAARQMADIVLHVEAHNYGVVEDVHQAIMHILAQYLRQRHMHEPSMVASRTF